MRTVTCDKRLTSAIDGADSAREALRRCMVSEKLARRATKAQVEAAVEALRLVAAALLHN